MWCVKGAAIEAAATRKRCAGKRESGRRIGVFFGVVDGHGAAEEVHDPAVFESDGVEEVIDAALGG